MLKPQSTMEDLKSEFRLISKGLGTDWKKLGRCLSLEDPELDNIDIKYPDLEEKAYQMSRLWLKRQKLPTHDALVSALEQVERLDLKARINLSTTSIFY